MLQGARSATDHRGSKLEWMQYFSTALSHLIVLGRDAVGLGVGREVLIDYLPPIASVQQRSLIHASIEKLKPTGQTDLSRSLDDLIVRARRRGVLVVISDFLVPDLDRVMAGFRKFRSRGWEIIALHLVHPVEERLPTGNAFRYSGLESDGEVNCQWSDVHREYEKRFSAHLGSTRAALLSVGCDYHRTLTSVSYLEVLRKFLVQRRA